MTIPFVFFSNRLSEIKIYNDVLKDFEFYNHISSFELHVFGIVNQYQRIQEVLKQMMSIDEQPLTTRNHDFFQVKLDIYYFILTWDKLKKIFTKIKLQIKIIEKEGRTTNDFVTDYKLIVKRIEHLFLEYNNSVRNEYEHPSLKFQKIGKIITYGNMIINDSGITVHVGNNVNVTIKKIHIGRLETLRIELIDLLIKHFTDKILVSDLLKFREDFINDVENNIENYKEIINGKNKKLSSELFNKLFMTDNYLSTEGIPVPNDIQDKIYKILF